MRGRRMDSLAEFYAEREPGSYVKINRADGNGNDAVVWYVCDPQGNVGSLGNHTVTEHENGTITVEPSILDPDPGGYHGWLRKGVWDEVW